MIYGEVGKFPLEIAAKSRMLNFWYRLVKNSNTNKFSSVMYRFLLKMHLEGICTSQFIGAVKSNLEDLGMSGIWHDQDRLVHSQVWFSAKVKRSLEDQFIQEWYAEVRTKECCLNYRIFKAKFGMEACLQIFSCPNFYTIQNIKPQIAYSS